MNRALRVVKYLVGRRGAYLGGDDFSLEPSPGVEKIADSGENYHLLRGHDGREMSEEPSANRSVRHLVIGVASPNKVSGLRV